LSLFFFQGKCRDNGQTYRVDEEKMITSYSRFQTKAFDELYNARYNRNEKPTEIKKRKADQLSLNLKRKKNEEHE
jgi:hypothetical protein